MWTPLSIASALVSATVFESQCTECPDRGVDRTFSVLMSEGKTTDRRILPEMIGVTICRQQTEETRRIKTIIATVPRSITHSSPPSFVQRARQSAQ
jgi:hypothetical protein